MQASQPREIRTTSTPSLRTQAGSHSDQQVIQRGGTGGHVGQVARVAGGVQLGEQALAFGLVKGDVGFRERRLFGAGEFPGDEVGDLGKVELVVERHEVGFDSSSCPNARCVGQRSRSLIVQHGQKAGVATYSVCFFR